MSATHLHAAGGVVWRIRDRRVEIALVHRPRYDDWTLPKGKLEDGEGALAAARREVREETGSTVAVSRRLRSISYRVGSATKTVTFWVMAHRAGEFTPNDEVDTVEWLRPKAAHKRLTHRDERRVLADFESLPLPESLLVLVRHAKAGKRSDWPGDDADRPLEPSGAAQALGLVPFLTSFVPDRIVSATPLRCQETVAPFATAARLPVSVDGAFDDAAFAASPGAAERALRALTAPRTVSVVSSQGDAIPGLVSRLVKGLRSADTKKAAAWVLTLVDGSVVSADYYDDAWRG